MFTTTFYVTVAGGLPMGGLDLAGMMSNPMLMNMATSLLSDPNMQQMMSQLMSGRVAEGGPESIQGLFEA